MTYIDGFVIPVPQGKKEDYRKVAEEAAPLFREYGAIGIGENFHGAGTWRRTSGALAPGCPACETAAHALVVRLVLWRVGAGCLWRRELRAQRACC